MSGTTRRTLPAILAAVLIATVPAACATRERGPFEQAGHEVDKGLDKTGKTLEKAGKDTGNALERFGRDVGDFFERVFD